MEDHFNQMLALDDVNLPHSLRRSIWLIRDEEDSNNYTADEILDDKPQDIIFNMRATLTAAYKSGESKYVCPFCGQPVGLKVRTYEGDFFPFFSHYQDSDDTCPLKTTNDVDPSRIIISTEEHFKESVLHQDMVSKLKEILELSDDFKEIEVDKVISTPEVTGYRRPSLYSIYCNDNKVCFDALISNPQIGLLVGRNAFYKMQKMFYLWVFPDFSVQHQRMCEKDILYMNRRNVFVFDSLDYYNNTNNRKYLGSLEPNRKFAYEESIRQKRLMLNCYWQVPVLDEKGNVSITWKGPKLVPFDEIVLDNNNFETYYHDSDQDFYHSYSPEKQQIIDDWMRIKEDRWKKIFDSIEKRKLLYEQALARRERRERLAYYYALIESGEVSLVAFQDETTKLWGFKVNDNEIISASFSDVMPFNMGFALVKKKRYWGIIDYKGNNRSNFEYKDVRLIRNGIYSLSLKDAIKYIMFRNDTFILCDKIIKLENGKIRINADGLWGEINNNNEIIIPFEYESIMECVNGFITAQKNDKWGIINEEGKIVIPFDYESIYAPQEDGMIRVKKDGKWGVIDIKNEIVIPIMFDYVGEYRTGLISAEIDKRWGVINESGATVIPFDYESIYAPQEDGMIRVKKDGKWGVVDKGNNVLIPFDFDDIGLFNNGRAKAMKYRKWGIIDERGNIKCSFEYDRIDDDDDNYWQVMKRDYQRGRQHYNWYNSNEKWGLVNMEGDIVVPCEYDAIYPPISGKIRCKKNKKWGYINENEEILIPFVFDSLDAFVDGKAKAYKHMRSGYINEKGEEIYSYRELSNAMIVYESLFDNKCGLMNEKREIVTGLDYSIINEFKNGITWAKREEYWGCINEKGQEIIPFEYDEVEDFVEGKARVQKYSQWGYIKEDGEEVYNVFEEIGNGILKYKSVFYDVWGLMTDSHMVITKPEFQQIDKFDNGFAIAKKEWNWGIINEKGDTIIPFEYDALKLFIDGKAIAIIRDKWGCVDENRKVLVPFEYDEITYYEGKFLLFMNRGYDFLGRPRKKLVKKVNVSNKPRTIDLSKIESNTIYLATVTGLHKVGVFINIIGIGDSLIPSRHIKEIGKSINNFKKGMQMKVQLLNINEEKQQATFKIIEEEL